MRTLVVITLLAMLASSAALAQSPTYPIDLSKLRYKKSDRFPGIETSIVFGSRTKSGLYTTHARVAAGAKVPPHVHRNTLTTWVTSGTAYVGTGNTFDETKLKAYPAGTFFVTPAGSPHFIYAKDGPFTILDHGSGPSSFQLVGPN